MFKVGNKVTNINNQVFTIKYVSNDLLWFEKLWGWHYAIHFKLFEEKELDNNRIKVVIQSEPIRNCPWYLGIDHIEFSENGNLEAYFYTDAKNQTSEELNRFVVELSDFIKDYK